MASVFYRFLFVNHIPVDTLSISVDFGPNATARKSVGALCSVFISPTTEHSGELATVITPNITSVQYTSDRLIPWKIYHKNR